MHDHFDDRRVQAFGAVHRCRAAFDVVHLGAFVDDDQRPFELPHAFGVDAEVGLQRKFDLDARGHVDERTARPDGRIERGKFVVVGRNDCAKVLAQQIRMFSDRRVGVGEDDALACARSSLQRAVDDFAFELSLHAGQELLFGLGDAQLVEGVFDLLRHIVPGLALVVGRLQVVVDVLEIEIDVTAPLGIGLDSKISKLLEPEITHPVGLVLHLRNLVDDLRIETLAGLENRLRSRCGSRTC